jgi:hypothetical protein
MEMKDSKIRLREKPKTEKTAISKGGRQGA